MTDFEQYKEQKREISLDYLATEKHFSFVTLDEYFIQPERAIEHPCAIGNDTVMLNSGLLAAALTRLPERKREMVYLRFFESFAYKELGKRYGRHRCTVSVHIRKALRQLQQEMEDYQMRTKKLLSRLPLQMGSQHRGIYP